MFLDKGEVLFGSNRKCVVVAVILQVGLAESESIQHYKLLSSVEYSGEGQFKNQVETLLNVRKQFLSDNKVQYFISSEDFDLLGDSSISDRELSFIVDEVNGRISESGKDLGFLEKINNYCIGSLKKVTRDNIGKTWKQSFSVPFLEHLFSGDLNLTLTAMKMNTEVFGDVIAVRALSEPFIIKSSGTKKQAGNVQSKIGAVYLFDKEIEEIYMSISVFEATTDINGSKERLRHEVGTYMTDSTGLSVNLSGLGKDFENFVSKVGLNSKSLKVEKETSLPQWAQYEGLTGAQVAHICAATACEGAPNPVASLYVPTVRTLAMQSRGTLLPIGMFGTGTVSGALASNVVGMGGMKIAAGPLFMGISPLTAGLAAGGGATAIAAGGGGSGSSSRSPDNP